MNTMMKFNSITEKDSNTKWYEPVLGACAVATLGLLVVFTSASDISAQQSNFVGGAPEVEAADDARISRLRFNAGARSNWHSHSVGQLLMIIEGRAVTQVRGEPVMEMHPGEPWYTDSGVVHWHGAHPEEDAFQLTISMGQTNWFEPVTDEQYLATPQRP